MGDEFDKKRAKQCEKMAAFRRRQEARAKSKQKPKGASKGLREATDSLYSKYSGPSDGGGLLDHAEKLMHQEKKRSEATKQIEAEIKKESKGIMDKVKSGVKDLFKSQNDETLKSTRPKRR
jgi:hypothetical protein